ncbi:ribbon-helix-helix protein, CopG family [Nitrospinae bacterium AH_259_B05_G02_I21]|nr:ribbon-helix-helix protein, CopG family [Nitrospinae bacterium AH_259_B05_G02_I21]MDA2932148.1 ribbon-helix-helix protein, CopG family [Nitrospinae bacterium AH-259-F20]
MNPEATERHDATITFRLPKEDREKIERIAAAQGLTVAEVLRYTIRHAMECPDA